MVVRGIVTSLLAVMLIAALALPSRADITDPYDPFDPGYDALDKQSEEQASATELLAEAHTLLLDERPLDARTKLLAALKKDPKQYRIHMLLSGYYMQHVGHFRLAYRYADQALKLFQEKHGQPPYRNYIAQSEHKQILYLLTQARLNLDNYQGALDTLDEYTSYKYIDDWYPGTRAWILMKLGRLDEAIRIARIGVLSGAEGGRALNMLGILLSMKGDRQQSLEVFRKAIEFEFALGKEGQPATPLNNSGEVYKEIFEDTRAESAWLKATSLPDGCDHVLPSLNLALLYIDQHNLRGVKRAMDNFESCIAQFPLRNGEEHKALVHLARGRLALHTGRPQEAITLFSQSLEARQWFGKIGTDEEDLEAAALISLGQAYRAAQNHLAFTLTHSVADSVKNLATRLHYASLSWWYLRRGRQILTEQLGDFEDLNIRHTDSLLEYSTVGDIVAEIPTALLEARLEREQKSDPRGYAASYYQAYLGENLLAHGRTTAALQLLQPLETQLRPQFDRALLLHVQTLLLGLTRPGEAEYTRLAQAIFDQKHAQLRNHGLRLPVNFTLTNAAPSVVRELNSGGFFLDNSTELQYSLIYDYAIGEHELSFVPRNRSYGGVKVRGNSLTELINRFAEEVFSEAVK